MVILPEILERSIHGLLARAMTNYVNRVTYTPEQCYTSKYTHLQTLTDITTGLKKKKKLISRLVLQFWKTVNEILSN